MLAWNNGRHPSKTTDETVDDSIPADREIQRRIDSYIGDIDRRVLKEYGLSYWKVIARTGFDMPIVEDESPIGNLIADSIRWYVNRYDYDPADPATKVVASIEANGVIRDSLLRGKTGRLAVAASSGPSRSGSVWTTPGRIRLSRAIYGRNLKRP